MLFGWSCEVSTSSKQQAFYRLRPPDILKCDSQPLSTFSKFSKETVFTLKYDIDHIWGAVSDEWSDQIPDWDARHLLFFQNAQVYRLFWSVFGQLYENENYHASHYFVAFGKQNWKSIKIRKTVDSLYAVHVNIFESGLKMPLFVERKNLLGQRKCNQFGLMSFQRMEYQKWDIELKESRFRTFRVK